MYKFLNDNNNTNSLINALPNELKNIIIDTRTVSGHGSNDANNFTSIDKLYLLSTAEVWAQGKSNTIDYDAARDKTRQLDYYKKEGMTTNSYTSAIKKDSAGTDTSWWLRCAASDTSVAFYRVNSSGGWNYGNASGTRGVSPAFRIG